MDMNTSHLWIADGSDLASRQNRQMPSRYYPMIRLYASVERQPICKRLSQDPPLSDWRDKFPEASTGARHVAFRRTASFSAGALSVFRTFGRHSATTDDKLHREIRTSFSASPFVLKRDPAQQTKRPPAPRRRPEFR
jgi:hypothetical protein